MANATSAYTNIKSFKDQLNLLRKEKQQKTETGFKLGAHKSEIDRSFQELLQDKWASYYGAVGDLPIDVGTDEDKYRNLQALLNIGTSDEFRKSKLGNILGVSKRDKAGATSTTPFEKLLFGAIGFEKVGAKKDYMKDNLARLLNIQNVLEREKRNLLDFTDTKHKYGKLFTGPALQKHRMSVSETLDPQISAIKDARTRQQTEEKRYGYLDQLMDVVGLDEDEMMKKLFAKFTGIDLWSIFQEKGNK